VKLYYFGKKLRENEIKSGGDRYIFEVLDYLEKNLDLEFFDISDRNWKATFAFNLNNIVVSLISNLWAINKLRHVRKGEIILTNAYYKKFFYIFAWVARYLKQCRLIIGANAFYYTSRKNKFLNWLDRCMMWIFLWPASLIIANSEGAKEALAQLGLKRQKVEVVHPRIHLPPDLPKTIKDKSRSKLEIIYVGHLSPYQKTHILIEALGKIPNLDFHLHVVGEPRRYLEYFQRIKKMALDCAIEDKVTFHGILKSTDLSFRYKNADILVSTLDTEGGIGRVVIEGMHFGVIPIVVDRIASREFIENNVSGFLYPANKTELLADLILRLYNDRVLLRRMTKNVRKASEKANFSKNIGEQFLNLIFQNFERAHINEFKVI